MRSYIDFNCKLPLQTSKEELLDTLLFMHERFCINRVCFMTEFDVRLTSLAAYRIRCERFLEELKDHLPKPLKINCAAAVHLTPALSQYAELSRLHSTSRPLLPLVLPMESYADWMDEELNAILYKRHIVPLFLSFDLYPILYPKAAIERLLRIPNAAYQFNYRAFTRPEYVRMIDELLRRGAPVLFGTGCTFPEKVYHYEFEHYIDLAKKAFSPTVFDTLMKSTQRLW